MGIAFRAIIVVASMAAGCVSAKTITVAELEQTIGAAAAKHRPDPETAEQISELELSERITEDTLALLQSRAPGPKTAAALEDLMAESAFLDPPATERGNWPAPPIAEQQRMFERMVRYVLNYAKQLPNLICTESISRFDNNPLRSMQRVRALGPLHFLDTITAQVTYSKGGEALVVKTVDSKPYHGAPIYGVSTSGEFGNALISLIETQSHTKASWSHWQTLHGRRIAVFRYWVAAPNSTYKVSFGCKEEKAALATVGYDGQIFIEPDTGTIVRVTRRGVGFPANFPTRQAMAAIDYGPVSIGGNSLMLPMRSVALSNNPVACNQARSRFRMTSLNETRFSSYRLFEAESKLIASAKSASTSNTARSSEVESPAVSTTPEIAPPETDVESLAPDGTQQSFLSLPRPPPFMVPEKPAIDENSTFATHATFRERVSIVTVPVVVRDSSGRAVDGLTKDDFDLLDGGKRQVIANFTEERSSAETARAATGNSSEAVKALPRRFLAFVFDDIHLAAGTLSQSRAAAERVMPEVLAPGTRVAVLTTSGKVSLAFTDNRDKIVATLNRVHSNPIAMPRSSCPDVSYEMADQIINHNDDLALKDVERDAIAQCNIVPQLARTVALSASRQSLQVHDYETRVTLDAIRGIAAGMAVLPGERTMILVSPGFYTPAGLPGLDAAIDRAARSGLMIQALDARGLYTPAGFDADQSEPDSPNKRRHKQTEQDAAIDPLIQLASATGGEVFRNSNDYDAGFRRISAPPSVVYLLGFSPSEEKADGAYHKLKVTLRGRKGLEVQARRGYIAHKAGADAEKEAREEMSNALLSRDEMRDISMTLDSSQMTGNAEGQKLKLVLHVDAKQVQFQKQDGRNRDKLTFDFGLFDADGGVVGVLGRELPLDLSDSDLQARLETGLNIAMQLDVKPGARFLRVVLRDAEGQMSTVNGVISQ